MFDKLNELLEKAKGLLGSDDTPVKKATDAVAHDRFDERLYRELLEDAPALADLVEEIGEHIDYADDLVRDSLMQLWQGDPRVRPTSEMAESHLINHSVAKDVERSESLAKARAYTTHDRYGAAMATIGISEEVRRYAKEHGDRLKEAEEERKRAEEEKEKAEDDLKVICEGFPGPGDGPPGDGEHGEGQGQGQPGDGQPSDDLTEQQVMDLEAAIKRAEEAQKAAEEARQNSQQQAQEAQKDLRSPMSKALRQTTDDLEEEADLFRAWGVEDGDLQHMDFAERAKLAKTLKGSRLARFSDLVGRFKLMAAAQRVRKIEYGRDQVVGTELSGDLARVVATELNALAMGDDDVGELLELDFYRRWFEDQLLSREFEGHEKVGKGAIIAVWDESGSMTDSDGKCGKCGSHNLEVDYYADNKGQCLDCGGWAATREAWAKALALALLDVARQQKRDFVGIGFSSAGQQIVWRFPRGKGSTTDVLKMVEHFFGGGTNFEAPVDLAVDILEEEFNDSGKMRGDLVFITDDDCMVTPEWLSQYLKRKERLDFRTFGIAVGTARTEGALAAMSDNVRAIKEFSDPSGVRDIFQIV